MNEITVGEAVGLLHKYIDPNRDLFDVVYRHSRSVADLALQLLQRHQELEMDAIFVETASLLHDIGVVRVKAPEIFCFGNEPYIRHGLLGAEILNGEGLGAHALVCERHTGTGLTLNDIEQQQLPLPHRDMSPQTLEEQLICFADKFYSKNHLDIERTPAEARDKLLRFGDDSLARYDKWCEMFL